MEKDEKEPIGEEKLCMNCRFYLNSHTLCRRYPKYEIREPNEWCGEYATLTVMPLEKKR